MLCVIFILTSTSKALSSPISSCVVHNNIAFTSALLTAIRIALKAQKHIPHRWHGHVHKCLKVHIIGIHILHFVNRQIVGKIWCYRNWSKSKFTSLFLQQIHHITFCGYLLVLQCKVGTCHFHLFHSQCWWRGSYPETLKVTKGYIQRKKTLSL